MESGNQEQRKIIWWVWQQNSSFFRSVLLKLLEFPKELMKTTSWGSVTEFPIQ
jgi:hypothetical protein